MATKILFVRMSESEWQELERLRIALGLRTYTALAKRAIVEMAKTIAMGSPANDSKRRSVA